MSPKESEIFREQDIFLYDISLVFLTQAQPKQQD
jgi:hypothetical protein